MSFRKQHAIPDLGIGVGFRPKHTADVLDAGGSPDITWYEVISENYMVPGGRPRSSLARLRERYPVVPHGVTMSVGAVERLDDADGCGLRSPR